MYEDAAEKSMEAMTHIYSYSRWIIVNRYSKRAEPRRNRRPASKTLSKPMVASLRLSV